MKKNPLLRHGITMLATCPGEISEQTSRDSKASLLGAEIISAVMKGDDPSELIIDEFSALMEEAVTPKAISDLRGC